MIMISKLVLSVFPGIDLLGKAFENEGFSILRGPDPLFGGDIRDFDPPVGIFEGIIGGSPCQDFSKLNRNPGSYGLEMLAEFARVVMAARPEWYILENIRTVPDLKIPGYHHQRITINALECGSFQSRNRVFQWGSNNGYALIVERTERPKRKPVKICLASEGTETDRRSWPDFCAAMDLPRDFDLPGWSIAAKYRAVGNGVPLKMGETIARAVSDRRHKFDDPSIKLCKCECGRLLTGKQRTGATDACRKRIERARKRRNVSCLAGQDQSPSHLKSHRKGSNE